MKTRLKLLLSLTVTLTGVIIIMIPTDYRFIGLFPFLIGLFHTIMAMGQISDSYLNVRQK